MIVVVVLVLACLAVLGAVVVVAMGRGGELSRPPLDHPPLPAPDDHPFAGPEPVKLPQTFWGYQVDITDEAVHRLRHALYERDVRVAALERQVDDLRQRLEESRGAPEEFDDAHEGRAEDDARDDTVEERVDLVKDNEEAHS
jgi:hypothetical protein